MKWISVKERLPDYSARKRGLPTMPLDERLKANMVVNVTTGCWEWQGSKRNGYGRITIGSRKDGTRRVAMAHRVSYELFKGEIPDGMEICHKCDNPCCINPNHLFAGTRQDNIDDREQKGRNNPPKGEHNGRAKLTKSQIVEIRQKHQQGATLRGLGREYGVNKTTIADIVSGKHWVDVELPEPPEEGICNEKV